MTRCLGDRDGGDYASLATGTWDAVVDVSAYLPRHVAQAIAAVGQRCGRYLFISTGSVYDREAGGTDLNEDSPRVPPVRDTEVIDGETYGGLKVACEDDVLGHFDDRATIVRPGVVAGPYDPTDRFTWWVRRAARGGRVALPGRPEQPVQVVDSGDLARLVTALLGDDRPGIYNAVGPAEPVTLEGLIRTCADAAGAAVEVVPVPSNLVQPRLPLVLPDAGWDVMFRRSAARARAVGLPATPLVETAAAVLAWDRARGEPPLEVELTPEREAELLALMHAGAPWYRLARYRGTLRTRVGDVGDGRVRRLGDLVGADRHGQTVLAGAEGDLAPGQPLVGDDRPAAGGAERRDGAALVPGRRLRGRGVRHRQPADAEQRPELGPRDDPVARHEHEQEVVLAAPHDDGLHDVDRLDSTGRGRLREAAHRPVPDHPVGHRAGREVVEGRSGHDQQTSPAGAPAGSCCHALANVAAAPEPVRRSDVGSGILDNFRKMRATFSKR